MTTVTHTIVGLAVGKVLYNISPEMATLSYEKFVLFSGFISNLPDFNMLWVKNLYKHHDDFTHYPLTLLIVTMLLLVAGMFIKLPLEVFALLILWGIHLCMDLFGIRAGLRALHPIKKREYSITKIRKDESMGKKDEVIYAIRNGVILTELVLITPSIYELIWR